MKQQKKKKEGNGGGKHNGSSEHNGGSKHNGGTDGYSEKKGERSSDDIERRRRTRDQIEKE
uniref:Uncharacterized protein n=1 Tax=Cucumis melo TaxID=3656 RepID=A0A9I9DMH7_CUCME